MLRIAVMRALGNINLDPYTMVVFMDILYMRCNRVTKALAKIGQLGPSFSGTQSAVTRVQLRPVSHSSCRLEALA